MKKILITILSFAALSGTCQSQSTLLERYRAMALDYNYDLKAAQKSIEASMEFEKMARADTKPKLAAGANFQYTGNPMELTMNLPSMDSPVSFQGSNMQYGASVSLLQPIYTGGRVLESIRMAQHQQSLASSTADLVRSLVCFQTDIQYWNTVARYEMIGITNDLLKSINSLVNTVKERVEVGMVDPGELLMVEVKLNEAKYQLLQAQSNFETSRMALNSMIGVDVKNTTQIDEQIPVLVASDMEANERPEVMAAQNRVKIAETTLKLNDSKYKPQFYVGADGNYSSPGYNFKADLNPNYALYAKVSIPIFEWGKRDSERRASAKQVEIAADNLSRVEDDVNLEIETARVALSQAVQRVELSLSSLGKARENEQKAMERYNEGKSSILEVIDAQTYRQTAQINYVQAKATAQGHYAELMKATANVAFVN